MWGRDLNPALSKTGDRTDDRSNVTSVLARRLLIALAVLMVLTALAAGLSPRESTVGEDSAATPAAPTEPAPAPVQETLDAAAGGQRVVARVGQSVTIVVRSAELDSVSLAEVGTKTTEPDSPARFELLAEVPGTYPIELLEAGRRIGVLEIRD
jgi:hypothetical protein